MLDVERARELYRAGRFEEAAAVLEERCRRQPDDADAWWMLGCVARHRARTADSDRAFLRAAELLPRQMPQPHRVPVAVFESLVRQARQDIRRYGPDDAALEVTVQQLPAGDAVRAGLAPDARWSRDGDRVTVYQANHENVAGSDKRLLQLLTATLYEAYGNRRRPR